MVAVLGNKLSIDSFPCARPSLAMSVIQGV